MPARALVPGARQRRGRGHAQAGDRLARTGQGVEARVAGVAVQHQLGAGAPQHVGAAAARSASALRQADRARGRRMVQRDDAHAAPPRPRRRAPAPAASSCAAPRRPRASSGAVGKRRVEADQRQAAEAMDERPAFARCGSSRPSGRGPRPAATGTSASWLPGTRLSAPPARAPASQAAAWRNSSGREKLVMSPVTTTWSTPAARTSRGERLEDLRPVQVAAGAATRAR